MGDVGGGGGGEGEGQEWCGNARLMAVIYWLASQFSIFL